MHEIRLTGLDGSNPLAFLAGLGALAISDRMMQGPQRPRLAWTGDAVPVPVLRVEVGGDGLIALVLADRDRWTDSPALQFPPYRPAGDVKFAAGELREWLAACAAAEPDDAGRALDLVTALVAEGSYTNAGEAKPTDLHFTAGQQQFLRMARTLRDDLSVEHLEEALFGPWRYESTLPSLKWDVTDDRVYVFAPVDPGGDKKLTVPGAEWLALMGLALLPVGWRRGRTVTTGCSGRWKEGKFSWPLWTEPLSRDEVGALLGLPDLIAERPPKSLAARGVTRVYRGVITRSDQGGYGSFRPPRVVLDSAVAGI